MDEQIIKAFDKMTPPSRKLMMYLISTFKQNQLSYTLSKKKIAQIAGCHLSTVPTMTQTLFRQDNVLTYMIFETKGRQACIFDSMQYVDTCITFDFSVVFRNILFSESPKVTISAE